MKITICIGSSCHLKGSRQIVEQLQRFIAERKLESQIELAGQFCMGNCQHGVCVTVDGETFSLSPETTQEFFENTVLPRL
ncbi:MAG: NAD(P)H-dependent oxidoreductase subunit E [Clostridia bacterium]|nr:NAD(P)H-dependent oxidoreductase subunit E [Clostridia bacterium]